jgi:Ino eighty subunit 2
LDSDIEEEEEGMQMGGEEDAEGEDEEIEVVEEDDEEEVEEEVEVEDDDLDSDDETPMGGSRASTPDLSKLTKRQRARLEEGGSGHLLALPDGMSCSTSRRLLLTVVAEVQVKKHLTAEEHAMRRAEMARRRKNLSEKRNEEEKVISHPLPLPNPFFIRLILLYFPTNTLRWKQSTSSSKSKPLRPTRAAEILLGYRKTQSQTANR